MGVFNRTPYTNFHELNLNWVIKKIKEVAADNTFLKQFFKTIEDDHILGVVTKVTENQDNTVKTDYLNESTQQMDNYTVYNKTGTDGAISGAVTPIANRVTTAEGDIDDLETGKLDKTAMQTITLTAGQTITDVISSLPANSRTIIIQNGLAISDAPITTSAYYVYVVNKANSSHTQIDAVETAGGIATRKFYAIYNGTAALTWKEISTKVNPTLLLNQSNIPTDITSYAANWNKYRYLLIECQQYYNIRQSILVPITYFASTSSNSRVILSTSAAVSNMNTIIYYDIYQLDSTHIGIKASSQVSYLGISVYGIM